MSKPKSKQPTELTPDTETPRPARASKTAAAAALTGLDKIRASVADLRKRYGDGSIVSMSNLGHADKGVISTGSLSLDIATGVGGLPRGRIVELAGPESAGKSTLALHCVAEAQRVGGVCAYIDVEHSLDPVYAQAIGVDMADDVFLFSQPDSGEQALEMVEALVEAGVALVVVDSVAMLTPQKELEGDFGDLQMGSHARLMSQAMRKLTAVVANSGAVILFINQIRMKIGVLFGSPEVTTGGQALRYASSLRIDIRRRGQVKDGATAVGNVTDIKIVKNKCGPPFKEATVEIIWGKGINRAGDLVNAALELGVLELSGSWYSYQGSRIGQGMNSAAAYMEANPDVYAEVHNKCLAAMGIKS